MSGPTRKNPLRKYGITLDQFDRTPEVNAGVNSFMDTEVVPAILENAPKRTGEYVDGVKVTERSTTKGRGKVAATSKNAGFVEFGSKATPEYAPVEKAANKFGGHAYGG